MAKNKTPAELVTQPRGGRKIVVYPVTSREQRGVYGAGREPQPVRDACDRQAAGRPIPPLPAES